MANSENVEFSSLKLNKDDWSSHARKYTGLRTGDSLSRPMLQAAFQNHFFKILDDQIQKSKSSIKILCLCGGTGPEAKIMCERYDKSQIDILTTDSAEGMVEVAQEEINRANYDDRANTKVIDAMNIDVKDESYDAVTLILGPMLLPDAQKCFEQVAKILKPKGVFFTLTPGEMEIHDVFYQCKADITKASDTNAETKHVFLEQMVANWGTPGALKEKLSKSNLFNEITTRINQAINPAPAREDIDEILEILFANPGMSKFYTGNFTDEQILQWKEAVRQEFYRRQSAVEHGSYSLKMNCCSGSVVKA